MTEGPQGLVIVTEHIISYHLSPYLKDKDRDK